MSNVYVTLEQLANTSSKNEKISILKKANTETLRDVLELAYNPFINFYIRKIPKWTKKNTTLDLPQALVMLNSVYNREVTGNAALNFVSDILGSLSDEDASVVERVIQKDLRCSVAVGIINSAIGDNFIPEYPCMLASSFDTKLLDKLVSQKVGLIVDLKLDGCRVNAIVRNGKVEYRSRNGKQFIMNNVTLDADFIRLSEVIGFPEVVFDGELLVYGSDGKPMNRQIGNGIISKAIKGTITQKEADMIRATVWDFIPFKNFIEGEYHVPYAKRKSALTEAITFANPKFVSAVESAKVNTVEEAWVIFEHYLQKGEEGVIVKSPNGIWENRRSKNQVKLKAELECDLLITGYEPGTGKYEGQLGALMCESSDGVIKVSVGSGFNDEQRKTLTEKNTVGKIAAVMYNAVIKNKDGQTSLFLPRIVEVREDKTVADSSTEIK